ncbi:beta-eliminating lyase-related protein [Escherichia coli]|nr:beta-eliminating lyase-related protein [Escherichia coli]
MMRGDEASAAAAATMRVAESVKNISGYQYTIPTHQGQWRRANLYPVLIKKREQEKGLDRSKMVAFSNYFFDTTQSHSQINGCTVRKRLYQRSLRYWRALRL